MLILINFIEDHLFLSELLIFREFVFTGIYMLFEIGNGKYSTICSNQVCFPLLHPNVLLKLLYRLEEIASSFLNYTLP